MNKKKLKCLDLFAGTRSISRAFERAGHDTYSIEWDEQHENIDWYADISKVTAQDILERFGRPDVIWASPDCFTAGHLITTKEGYKPIEEIEIGDKVLTHKNRYKPVYAVMNKKTDHIHKIKIAGTEEIEVTEEHPFLARKKNSVWNNDKRSYEIILGEPKWIKAKDLDSSYRVQKLINQNSELPVWEGVKHSFNNQFGHYESDYFNELNPLLDSEDFWWLMGRYLGDGSYIYSEKLSKYQFEICCNKNNNESKDVKKVLDRLPFNYNFSKKKTTNVFSIHKKELSKFVSYFGKGSSGKFIPDFVFDLPQNLIHSLLTGYLSADGSRHIDKNNRKHFTVTTVSEKLAYGISSLLIKAYNIHPALINVPERNGEIEGRIIYGKKQYILSWYKDSKGYYTFDENSVWVNVRSNERVSADTTVYNISVAEDETYVVRNVTVHNCTSYSVAGIGHHRYKDENGKLIPKTEYGKFCDMTNEHVINLVKELNPTYYFIENPRGGMRKMDFIQDLPRYTVTYCQYSTDLPLEQRRMKPTDIWTNHPNPKFKPICKNGAPCHVAAPRGSKTGTQGIRGAVDRSRIPDQLCDHIVRISEEIINDTKGGSAIE